MVTGNRLQGGRPLFHDETTMDAAALSHLNKKRGPEGPRFCHFKFRLRLDRNRTGDPLRTNS